MRSCLVRPSLTFSPSKALLPNSATYFYAHIDEKLSGLGPVSIIIVFSCFFFYLGYDRAVKKKGGLECVRGNQVFLFFFVFFL